MTNEHDTATETPPRWLLVGDPLVPIAAIPTRAWLDWAWANGEEVERSILLSPRLWTSPQFVPLSAPARWALLAGLGYSAQYGLDGRVPKVSLRCLAFGEDPTEAVNELVNTGLWIEDGEEYVVAELCESDLSPDALDALIADQDEDEGR